MNQAIKLNPNFSTAFLDRGIANYDKHDYDRTIAAADPLIKTKPTYAVSFSGRGSAYENRREGDRIIQEANQPIRNNQYNAYAYSPDTFPPVSPPVAAPEPPPAPAQRLRPRPNRRPWSNRRRTAEEPQSVPPCRSRAASRSANPAQQNRRSASVMNAASRAESRW